MGKTFEKIIKPLLKDLQSKENQGKIIWFQDHAIPYIEMAKRILNGDPVGSKYAEHWLKGTVPSNPSVEALEKYKKKKMPYIVHVPLIEFLANGGNLNEGRDIYNYWGLTTQLIPVGKFKNFTYDDGGDITFIVMDTGNFSPDSCYIEVEAIPVYK